MTGDAVVLMVVALLLVWGGLIASVTFAVVRSRRGARTRSGGPGTDAPEPPDTPEPGGRR